MASSSFQPLQGMSDIAPPDVYLWQMLEARAREVFARYRFEEVRTPILEKTALFTHSLGDTTDVVTKEMYCLEDRGGRKLSLRPEGTAGSVRYIASGAEQTANARMYYMGPMFRCERPQAGRKRQFHQIGLEAAGAPNPLADAEVIALQLNLLSAWGLEGAKIRLNTIGLPEERAAVLEGLRNAIRPRFSELPEDAQQRFETNVLRLLDSKDPAVQAVIADVPSVTELLSQESRDYLNTVVETLRSLEIDVEIDTSLVRGLDYYVHTVWEVVHGGLGAQNALSGGGRYQVQVGSRTIDGVGFAMGMERMIAALESTGITADQFAPEPAVFIVSLGEAALKENLLLMQMLRQRGIACEMELTNRKIKAQMKRADKLGARQVIIRGDTELENGTFVVKNMEEGTQQELELPELMNLLT
ncbi:histidine--tRNA ligase [Tichowtungia aerotolerans]|uniref:Histidine--tRNA ligase n=1 Tax=Tichowtungia aerotolerans TaxID=2697043 RepID=A0A6P1MG77_9BACT|nr:histidine--tRNA ligase [Tichowtungia aerotolerans]QHI70606.1 histidine--tRNA ligase [Tichowtungia aerotolerans]